MDLSINKRDDVSNTKKICQAKSKPHDQCNLLTLDLICSFCAKPKLATIHGPLSPSLPLTSMLDRRAVALSFSHTCSLFVFCFLSHTLVGPVSVSSPFTCKIKWSSFALNLCRKFCFGRHQPLMRKENNALSSYATIKRIFKISTVQFLTNSGEQEYYIHDHNNMRIFFFASIINCKRCDNKF